MVLVSLLDGADPEPGGLRGGLRDQEDVDGPEFVGNMKDGPQWNKGPALAVQDVSDLPELVTNAPKVGNKKDGPQWGKVEGMSTNEGITAPTRLDKAQQGVLPYTSLSSAERDNLFEIFKEDHNKIYLSPEEETQRKSIFQTNLALWDKLRAIDQAGGGSAVFGMNAFSDLTTHEFKVGRFGLLSSANVTSLSTVAPPIHARDLAGATAADWRGMYTTAIRNQGFSGTCWAQSASSQIESDGIRLGMWSKSTWLSAMQLVTCDNLQIFGGQQCGGCNCGGYPGYAYQYVKGAGGLVTNDVYPYVACNDPTPTCPSNLVTAGNKRLTVVNQYHLSGEQAMINYVLSNGPISVELCGNNLQYVGSGVLSAAACCSSVNHAVQIVGVDTINGFWIIRNSWGTSWGDNGYMKLQLNTNACHVSDNGGLYVTTSVVGSTVAPVAAPTAGPPTVTASPSLDSSGCRNACYGHSCDYWFEGGNSCSSLINYYGCNCAGCSICGAYVPTASPTVQVTVPQAPTTRPAGPSASPSSVPTLGSTCNVGWLGDGYCDSINNNAACNYDNGDCCPSTCISTASYACGVNNYNCIDPRVNVSPSPTVANTATPTQRTLFPSGLTWIYLSVSGYSCSQACGALSNVCSSGGPWPQSASDFLSISNAGYTYFSNYPTFPSGGCAYTDTTTVNNAYPGYNPSSSTCFTGGSGAPSCTALSSNTIYRWCPCVSAPSTAPSLSPVSVGFPTIAPITTTRPPTYVPTNAPVPTIRPRPTDDDYYLHRTSAPTTQSQFSCGSGSYQVSTPDGNGGTQLVKSCQSCPGGTYSIAAGSTSMSCQVCPPGTHALVGSSICLPCNLGTVAGAFAVQCTACPAGSSSIDGTTCTLCPASTYSPLDGSWRCISCPAGKMSRSGASTCTSCPAGTSSSSGVTCDLCPAGAYSILPGSATCTPCPSGQFSSPGASACSSCSA